jgi:hypothetical protein
MLSRSVTLLLCVVRDSLNSCAAFSVTLGNVKVLVTKSLKLG